MFSVVINHFCAVPGAVHLAAASIFSAALSRRAELVREVMVVDGSPRPDAAPRARLEDMGCTYRHAGGRLSFAEGYNLGIAEASQEWVVLCASDVFPSLDCYDAIATFLARIDVASVGSIITRLSASDLPYQKSRFFSGNVCAVPVLTLNFNVFRREYLTAIGGVPEAFSGNYNDVELSIRIHQDRRRIYMLPIRCLHYGSLTLRSGGSDVSAQRDRATFAARYPELVDPGSMWDLRLTTLSPSALLTVLLQLARITPTHHARTRLTRGVLRLVPLLSPVTV